MHACVLKVCARCSFVKSLVKQHVGYRTVPLVQTAHLLKRKCGAKRFGAGMYV